MILLYNRSFFVRGQSGCICRERMMRRDMYEWVYG